jgi:hypothetical protein
MPALCFLKIVRNKATRFQVCFSCLFDFSVGTSRLISVSILSYEEEFSFSFMIKGDHNISLGSI